jgi:hypothetical protein
MNLRVRSCLRIKDGITGACVVLHGECSGSLGMFLCAGHLREISEMELFIRRFLVFREFIVVFDDSDLFFTLFYLRNVRHTMTTCQHPSKFALLLHKFARQNNGREKFKRSVLRAKESQNKKSIPTC